MREALYGGLDRDGELHRNVFTPESCAELLAACPGFVDARVIERGRRGGRRLEFELVARKARPCLRPWPPERGRKAGPCAHRW
ncbi:MAG: hypothetical protein U1E17_06000 [Geminicoccaceae bacterium]